MNAIKLANRVDLYIDSTRNARFPRIEYDNAVNDAIQIFIDAVINPDEKTTQQKGFQANQYISDKLYTLIKTQSAAPTADVALFPADYFFATSLFATIGGIACYCRPTNQNELGPLLDDTFRRPSDIKPYYLQNLTGFKIYHGAGTVSSVALSYLKTAAVFTIGKLSQLINAGAGVLTLTAVYIATEPSVHNAISYNIGDQFTAANTTLTSGQVILAANTTACDLPDRTHEEIAKLAATILTGVTQGYNQAAFAEKEAQKS